MLFISRRISYSLWGWTHTHSHTDVCTEIILRNQARAGLRPARAWFNNIVIDMLKFPVPKWETTVFVYMSAAEQGKA